MWCNVMERKRRSQGEHGKARVSLPSPLSSEPFVSPPVHSKMKLPHFTLQWREAGLRVIKRAYSLRPSRQRRTKAVAERMERIFTCEK